MYKWILKYRQTGGANFLNPRKVTQGGFIDNLGNKTFQFNLAYSEMISVSPGQIYQGHASTFQILRFVTFYDFNKQYLSGIDGYVDSFTVPASCYYVVVSFLSEESQQLAENMGLTLGLGSPFEKYFLSREVKPVYKKMGRGYDKQSNYQFYREKLDGNLKLIREDYDYVASLAFDQKIYLDIEDISGILPTYKGQFYKTDCKWDEDDRIVEIKTEPADDYVEILAGLDKTFNLIQKAPELQEVTLRRRPLIQVYIPGDNVVTNILGGTYWEQEIQVDPEFDHNTLVNTYKFFNSKNIRIIPASYGSLLSTDITGEYDENREIKRDFATNPLSGFIDNTGTFTSAGNWRATDFVSVNQGDILQYKGLTAGSAQAIVGYDINQNFVAVLEGTLSSAGSYTNHTVSNANVHFVRASARMLSGDVFEFINGHFRILEETQAIFPGYNQYRYTIERVSDGVDLYQTAWTVYQKPSINTNLFNGINGETGSFYFTEYRVYVRYYTDKLDVRGTNTYPVPETDIVGNNRNYKRVIGYNIDDFYTYDQFVTYPTKYGKVPSEAPNAGEYYKEFAVSVTSGLSNPLPVSSSNWRATSLWFFNNLNIRYTEFIDGQDFVLRDAFPLHSVIQVLLREIGSNLSHDNTSDFSEFLYAATNPLGGFSFLDFDGGTIATDYSGNLTHFLTPKSNIIAGEYDQPAQKADITLAQVLNMLRDVYKVFWHVENGKLRLEHITWYQKGGTYGNPIIGADLTNFVQPRNNKNWNFSENKWEFDKENMPERFEYGWMDDVSLPFEGSPIQINSNYVQLGRVEDLNVNGMTTDIDYIMGNPQEVSKDGFCLLSAVTVDGIYRIPFIERDIGYNQEVIMQNGFLSWLYLHPKFHVYDLPSDNVNINGEDTTLFNNNTRQKKQQIVYPASGTINPYQLVRTGLGDGLVDKLTIDMESRMIKATIKHDTE